MHRDNKTYFPQLISLKQIKSAVVIGVLLFPISGCGDFGNSADLYQVTPEVMAEKPISPLIYSNFIELGYGIQVEPMWGEMLFNRSFEDFTPYTNINKVWFDLYTDKSRKTYKTDWSGEDWYHSGYEHNPWFAAPGRGGLLPIDDNSTFFINQNPDSPVLLNPQNGGIHGGQYLRVENTGNSSGGLAQEGKYIEDGKSYVFTGYMKSLNSIDQLELRFYPEGDWAEPLKAIPIRLKGEKRFEKVELRFTNTGYRGRATMVLWIPPGSKFDVDAFSLMPEHTLAGWRPEAIACTQRVNPGIIRFPGGCFASFYNWRDGIGPKDSRPPQPSYFWGGFNYNDVGVAELAQFARLSNARVMYCVNVFHPFKEEWSARRNDGTGSKTGFKFPEFTDIEKGALEAADLVAYCNLPAGSHPMADLRVSHGYPDPFGIEYWEMDNEVSRWFSYDEYARAVNVYARAMKAVDPSILIGLVTYGVRKGESRYGEMLDEMLEICGPRVDFLADRRGAGSGLDEMLAKLKDFEGRTGRYIAYCNTERLFYEPESAIQDTTLEEQAWVNRSYSYGKWHYAMHVIKMYMAFQKRGGDVRFVCFNNLANTHNQCVINTPKEGAFLSASGVALEHLSRSPAAWPLVIKDYESTALDDYQVQAAWSDDKQALVLYVFNRTEEVRKVSFNISGLNRTFKIKETIRLSAEGPRAMNTLTDPDAIKADTLIKKRQHIRRSISVQASPYSFNQVVLQ